MRTLALTIAVLASCVGACHRGSERGASTEAVADASTADGVQTRAFQCNDLAVIATFHGPDGNVDLAYSGTILSLPRAVSASGARYADANGNEFWDAKGEAMFTLSGQTVRKCTVVQAAPSDPNARVEDVEWQPGAPGVTLTGTIKGYQSVDYRVHASAGQSLTVDFKTSNGLAYFNVLPPGSSDDAIFVGSTSGNSFTSSLAAGGVYTLRVYLMRSAARRDETANYTLDLKIS
ncbi:MAG TPA: MliC family protein [Povalibacter sp.]|nr:MliC family protein [Povalibacter sp.]